MLELTTTFTPADGSSPRTITLRISDVRPDPDGFTWSIAVDVLGFRYDDSGAALLPGGDDPLAEGRSGGWARCRRAR